MTKPKKKPKTGDVVGWVVLDRDGDIYDHNPSRSDARKSIKMTKDRGRCPPYSIGKIVLAK